MEGVFLQTERLLLRYITKDDFNELKLLLQDQEVMYAWEYCFSDDEVEHWINKTLSLYRECNLGYFIIEHRFSGEILGQAALMPDFINGCKYYEISYLLHKKYWHKGYATEAARALIDFAFNNLNLKEVIFEIRPNNLPSRKVAENLDAKITGEFIKNVKGKEMLHLIYSLYR